MGRHTLWLLLALLVLAAAPAMAATLSRDMPSRVDPGSDFTVRLMVPDAVVGASLTIEETLPKGVVLKTWDISGTKESQLSLRGDSGKFRIKAGAYGWSVTPTGPVTITYTATAPSSEGGLNFDAVWFDQSGFNHNSFTLSVIPAPAPGPMPSMYPAPSAPSQVQAPQFQVQKPALMPSPAAEKGGLAKTSAWVLIAGLVVLIAVLLVWLYAQRR